MQTWKSTSAHQIITTKRKGKRDENIIKNYGITIYCGIIDKLFINKYVHG